MAVADLHNYFKETDSPGDGAGFSEILARLPAMMEAVGHDDVILFFERCIAAVEKDRELFLCQCLKL